MMRTALILFALISRMAAARFVKMGSSWMPEELSPDMAPAACRKNSLNRALFSFTTAKRILPSAPPLEFPPNANPMSAVIASGTMRLIIHGSGLRQARHRSLASRTRSILFPQFPAGELQENIIEAGPLERDIFHMHRKIQQIFQAVG